MTKSQKVKYTERRTLLLIREILQKESRYHTGHSYILSSSIYLLHINNHYQIHH